VRGVVIRRGTEGEGPTSKGDGLEGTEDRGKLEGKEREGEEFPLPKSR